MPALVCGKVFQFLDPPLGFVVDEDYNGKFRLEEVKVQIEKDPAIKGLLQVNLVIKWKS